MARRPAKRLNGRQTLVPTDAPNSIPADTQDGGPERACDQAGSATSRPPGRTQRPIHAQSAAFFGTGTAERFSECGLASLPVPGLRARAPAGLPGDVPVGRAAGR